MTSKVIQIGLSQCLSLCKFYIRNLITNKIVCNSIIFNFNIRGNLFLKNQVTQQTNTDLIQTYKSEDLITREERISSSGYLQPQPELFLLPPVFPLGRFFNFIPLPAVSVKLSGR